MKRKRLSMSSVDSGGDGPSSTTLLFHSSGKKPIAYHQALSMSGMTDADSSSSVNLSRTQIGKPEQAETLQKQGLSSASPSLDERGTLKSESTSGERRSSRIKHMGRGGCNTHEDLQAMQTLLAMQSSNEQQQ